MEDDLRKLQSSKIIVKAGFNMQTQPELKVKRSLLTTSNSIANIPISIGTFDNYVKDIINLAKNHTSSYVCVMNVHMFVEAYYKNSFRAILDHADVITPDGKPLTWALSLLKGVLQARVAGMDLVINILKEIEHGELSVFFYGGTNEMLDRTKNYLKKNYPAVKTSGFVSPPFRELSTNEEDDIAATINTSKANIVFVILGCPKQEKWMGSMKGKVNAVMIGIGGALPVMIGMQQRAPKWMQEIGMEWFYRLHLEPKRLFKRYAITNSIFIILIFREVLKKKSGTISS